MFWKLSGAFIAMCLLAVLATAFVIACATAIGWVAGAVVSGFTHGLCAAGGHC